jgi:hypothetical protein
MKAIYNKVSLILIALLITKVSSEFPDNVIFKYCVVHSWSPKGPEGDYANPYSNYIISLSTVSAPAVNQQPELSDFETQNENYLYVKKSEIDNDTSDPSKDSSIYKGDASNLMLSNFCPTEGGRADSDINPNIAPKFNTPFVFWVEAGYCENREFNEILYPENRFVAHFAFFKNWFSAYQKYKALDEISSKYYLIGWSRDGTIDNNNRTGPEDNGLVNYNNDVAVGDADCGGSES